MKKISKYDEHMDSMARFLWFGDYYFSPDTGQRFVKGETYMDDPNCANCGKPNWFPGKTIEVKSTGSCIICNKHVYPSQWANCIKTEDIHAERLRAERVCDKQDASL